MGTAERVEPLETCDPSALREGTSVRVWERRSDLLTTAPPGPESQVLPIALTILVAAWAWSWASRCAACGARPEQVPGTMSR